MKNLERFPEVLTPEQAAAYLQVNRETIYRYIREGKLDASRLGRSYRIRRTSLEHLLAATRVRGDIVLRTFSPQQLQDFLEADALDEEAEGNARRFAQAHGFPREE